MPDANKEHTLNQVLCLCLCVHACVSVFIKAQTNIQIFGLIFVLPLFDYKNKHPIIHLLFSVVY